MNSLKDHTDLSLSDTHHLLVTLQDITSCRTREDVQDIVSRRLAKYFQFNEVMVCLNNSDNLTHNCYIHTVSPETRSHPDFARGSVMKYFINDGIFNIIEESEEPVIFDMEELVRREDKPFYVDFWYDNKVKEMIGFPLRMSNVCIGAVTIYPKERNTFTKPQLSLAQTVCSYIGIALSNILAYDKIKQQLEEIHRHKFHLEEENNYLQEQIQITYGETIGSDNGLKGVFQMVSNVAPSDSTVLILGETGTGKELIARAIHLSSSRRGKLMIKVNCAALPANLIESELFGHEKGSFTGATQRRIGKFELASGSTLFLDEIGEMPPELQVKLLRVLQEREIVRIGGRTVIRTDVRVIAATNRNLSKEIEAGRFRSDLFYRLNVFPITLPPLRERMEDIPALVSHFVEVFARKTGKSITGVATRAIQGMMLYSWPGNVRELEHVIERSVLMSHGGTIKDIILPKQDKKALLAGESSTRSLKQLERDHILAALKKSNGRVGGQGGAAEILQLPPTTLHSRIKKLGIKKVLE